MGNLLNSFIAKPTLFSSICSLIIVIGTPLAAYFYTKGHDGKLGAAYLFFLIAIAIILLFIDRISINFVKTIPLSIVEFLFLMFIFLFVSHKNKKLIVNLNNYEHNYFITILNNGDLENSPLTYSFPFNKSVDIHGKHFVLDPKTKEAYCLEAKPSNDWRLSSKRVREVDSLEVVFQYKYLEKFDDSKIDSLIRTELEKNIRVIPQVIKM